MYDLIIKNGQIVDGTGNPSFRGDIGIIDGLVAKVANTDIDSPISDYGNEIIDAAGAIVAPGWVDTHSHMDGQATWDPYCSPANHHGITTLVMGNCGIGFAPCKPNAAAQKQLIQVVEDVEDIPEAALVEGITWNWETCLLYTSDAADE